MKKFILVAIALVNIMALASCDSGKEVVRESNVITTKGVDGQTKNLVWVKDTDVEMLEVLSDDGKTIVKRAVKWYAGTAVADDLQTAKEMAELEARATISRIINNMVSAKTERGTLVNNGAVQKALKSHWTQVSNSVQNACEPMSDTKIEHDPATNMYTVTVRVGIRGEQYQQLLNSASSFRPADLSGNDLQLFIDTNESIINAAKQ